MDTLQSPFPRAAIAGASAATSKLGALTLMANTSSICSGGVSAAAPKGKTPPQILIFVADPPLRRHEGEKSAMLDANLQTHARGPHRTLDVVDIVGALSY